jgi:BASS family bile acid:Na+ symporter
MSMQNAGEYIQRTLLFWLTACSLAAFFWPDMAAAGTLDPFLSTAPAIPYQFAVTMFCIGCLLPRKEVDALAKRWPTVLGGTTIQYLSMPLLAWGVATVLGLKGPYLVGVIVVGCVPGAMASNVLTLAARGNVSYSVSLTTTATIFSPFIVPLVLKLALSHEQDVPTQKIMIALLWQVVGPVIAGHVICRTASGFAQFMRGLGPIVANGTIIWIIAVVVAKNRANLQTIFDSDGAALSLVVGLLALNILGYLAGFGGGSALGLPNGMRRALTLEIGMQNAGLGTSLVQQFFAEEPAASLPPALYTFGCMVTGTLLAQWWNRHPPSDESVPESNPRQSDSAAVIKPEGSDDSKACSSN